MMAFAPEFPHVLSSLLCVYDYVASIFYEAMQVGFIH